MMIRVLLIEDDEVDQMAFQRFVKTESLPYDYVIAGSMTEAMNIMKSMEFDIIVTDYMLGDGVAFDIFPKAGDAPIIVVTGSGDEEIAVKAIKAGAYDYLIKDLTGNYLKTLPVALKNALSHKKATTELKKYQEQLEELVKQRTVELRIKDFAIESSLTPLVIASLGGYIEYANQAFLQTWGYECKEEVLGRHLDDFCKTEDDFIRIMKETGHFKGKGNATRKDGTNFCVDIAVNLTRDMDGNPIAILASLNDITNEIKLEKQLRQCQKMEVIGTLAGGIAHDFNNILTGIIGFTEIAMNKIPKENPTRSHLEQVLMSASRATDLVKQILTFSRQTEQERRPLKVVPIVKEVLKLLRSSLPSTIEIQHEIAGVHEDDMILGDPTQIYQVLMNLSVNAAHAMRAHGGVLSVSLSDAACSVVSQYMDLKPGSYIRLSVSDTGHGMDATVMERIFDPYFTTKPPGEGTGLGLSVAHGIIKNHGGTITVYSEPGQGTTFNIFLPRIKSQNTHVEKAAEQLPTGNERILLIDDEKTIALLGQEILESIGYSVSAETGSLEALNIFKAQPFAFDLVITDMTMPGLTGIELAREIKGIRPGIPIILCTGFSDLSNREIPKGSGFQEIIMKPYTASSLAKTIRKVLSENDRQDVSTG